jgi:hypothetical protein
MTGDPYLEPDRIAEREAVAARWVARIKAQLAGQPDPTAPPVAPPEDRTDRRGE